MNMKSLFGGSVFGKIPNSPIRFTIQGMGVKTKDGQVAVYDKAAKSITMVPDDLTIGDLPVFAMPTPALAEGDLIYHNGNVKFVREVKEGGNIVALNYQTQVCEEIIPAKTLFGYVAASKIISPFEGLVGGVAGGDLTKNPLMLMALMGDGELSMGDGDDDGLMTMLLLSGGLGGGESPFGDMTKNPLMSYMLFSKLFKE